MLPDNSDWLPATLDCRFTVIFAGHVVVAAVAAAPMEEELNLHSKIGNTAKIWSKLSNLHD